MSERHLSTPTGPRGNLRSRPSPLRTKSPSPARPNLNRAPDDLLSHLTPTSAVEALQSPTGPLKTCLDRASVAEQAFALKAAIASKTIHDWLGELSGWPWPSPSESTSAGFEMPQAKRRRLFEPETPRDSHVKNPHSDDVTYLGSLSVDDVVRYEERIEKIHQDMEGLNLEEIKNQVLHNHIFPLSRPGTPFSDCGRSVASAFSFAKMEEISAVVTAITVQALPALSKLSRLLNTWSLRLIVLRRVPSLLVMLADAEVALLSGWSAIEQSSPNSTDTNGGTNGDTASSTAPPSKKDFDIIKTVLEKKVAKLGRDLDFMLDALEGMIDTLPEEWLNRMEAIERNYAEWVTAAERKVREGECTNMPRADLSQHVVSRHPPPNIRIEDASPTKMPLSPGLSDYEPLGQEERESWAVRIVGDISSTNIKSRSSVHDLPENPDATVSTKTHHQKSPGTSFHASQISTDGEVPSQTYDGSKDAKVVGQEPRDPLVLSEVNRNIVRQSLNHPTKHVLLAKASFEEDFEPSILESVNEEDEEHELPPTYFEARKGSHASIASTMLPDSPDYLPNYSDHGTYREASVDLDLPRLPDPDEPFSSDALSPPSSPPLRYKQRSTSVAFDEIPKIAPLPEAGERHPRSLLEPPELFDADASFEWDSQLGSPSRMSTMSATSDDDHMQKQLRELLETIPAKIELKKRGINLNPPDLQLPSWPKPRYSDTTRRPTSALSSRADSRSGTPSYSRSGTPSFMLAPVRDNRPRSTSSHGIRLYHLSRSGEVPIKLFIRCVGEQNERVMVRVGGGWSDLGEYLRDYAIHYGSRSKGESKVEVTDAIPKRPGSSPASRPSSAHDSSVSPLAVRKTRNIQGDEGAVKVPRTPLAMNSTLQENADTPGSERSVRSRASSQVDWDEEDSSLGLAGPKAAKRRELNDESRAWIESVKQKVRLASGERLSTSASSEHLRLSQSTQARTLQKKLSDDKFGELGKVGSTKRLFRKN